MPSASESEITRVKNALPVDFIGFDFFFMKNAGECWKMM